MLSSLLLAPLLLAQPPAPTLTLESAKPRPEMTAWFTRTSGWTGADGAASVALGPKRTLWLFGDSWVGEVENGRRERSRMVNNTTAWQDSADPKTFRFFWDKTGEKPAALLKPEAADNFYWPGDGAQVEGRLYLFCKLVRWKQEGAPGFQFDWFANELLRIDNPGDEPTRWKVTRQRLPAELKLGSACIADGEYLYAYGLLLGKQKLLEAPLAVARIHRERLAKLDMTGWECWSKDGKWSPKLSEAGAMFRDGAPEMTVLRVKGIAGFVALYMPLGLSQVIAVRHAARPEGPWSEPLKVYRCPKEAKDVYVYAAKAHAELAEKDGQIIVTYCRNIGALGEHVTRPLIYAPQVVEVMLKSR